MRPTKYPYDKIKEEIPENEWIFPSELKKAVKRLGYEGQEVISIVKKLKKDFETKTRRKGTKMYKKEVEE